MNFSPNPAMTADVSNSVIAAAVSECDLVGASTAEHVERALAPLTSAIIEIMADARRVDFRSIYDQIAATDEQMGWVVDAIGRALIAGSGQFPVMRWFVKARESRMLRGLAELSFMAGREGDDETDWLDEAYDALCDAFDGASARWRDTARAALRRAFDAGVAQMEIDKLAGDVPDRSTAIARHHAAIYYDECDFPADSCPSAIDSAVSYVAYKLAEHHPITPAEAAHAAICAFMGEGMSPSIEVATHAMHRARAGYDERIAREDRARQRDAACRAAVETLFGSAA